VIIEPKVRGFICTAAHPVGCAANVNSQVDYVKQQGHLSGCRNVLVIGGSTGYGLASRIVAAFGCGAKTLSVSFEKAAAGKRTATAGWYNTAAFERTAKSAGLYAKSINGDAFSDEIKQQVIEKVQQDLGQIDLVVYSLASPRRTDPKTGETYHSTLKTVGDTFISKTVDPTKKEVKEVAIEPASQADIDQTVKVMGGEDWSLWIEALNNAGVLADNFTTVAYSYIGPELTHAVYKDGTIGHAKEHLTKTAEALNAKFAGQGRALISVNKSVVTQASAAIPVVPLYISIVFKLMKAKGTHEGCIEQMYRLFKDYLYAEELTLDAQGLIRIDELEMDPAIQAEVAQIWQQVTTKNLSEITDIAGYLEEFYHLFGFEVDGVNYAKDVEV
jgi:enoyl-[acyl-carrier protein] reductase/trans-2-enoyl-CoA reductase (NAD+)